MISSAPTSARELDRRSSDGIHVRLMWRENDGNLWVSVSDGKAGAEFIVGVGERHRALDVFHHPFAYAAHYGIDTDAAPERWLTASPASL